MPELPEVETIARLLRHGKADDQGRIEFGPVVGRMVDGVQLFWSRTFEGSSMDRAQLEAALSARVAGQFMTHVGRRGKFLVFSLTDDTLLIHLRMSGDIRVEPGFDDQHDPLPLRPHDRLVIRFTDGWRMVFNDPRKFGRAWMVRDPEEVLGKLGPEPFAPEFTPDELFHLLQTHHRQVKPLLLDQTIIAGMGNIYTDEALYLAGIHPLRLSSSISFEEAVTLWKAIRAVLAEGIDRNGASIDWVYRGGDFQKYFQVYQRTGQPCFKCGTLIEKISVGQRGTHFCPNCQQPG